MAASPGTLAGFGPPDFFVLRAPLLPFDALTQEAGGARLRALLARPEVREAVYVASPALNERLPDWERDPDSESGRKVGQSLTRYVARMAGRATPFGLFAGCSVGAVGRVTRLAVGTPRRHTRLDMDYVVVLTDALGRDPVLRPALRYTRNSSLYRVAGRARYLEVRRAGKGWAHHRAALEVPPYLDAVLTRAAGGATPAELTRALLDHDPDATEAEAAEYVAELIDQQVLVSELGPAVTGPEPIYGLIERLGGLPVPEAAAAAEVLSGVRDELTALDAGGPGAEPDRYHAVAGRLAALPVTADPSRLFQMDLSRPAAGATLGENVIAEIARGVELLRRLMPRLADDPLAVFRRAFAARFGDTPITREVPLAEALDDETGVGFGEDGAVEASSLLEGLDLATRADRSVPWDRRESDLLGRVTEALIRGETELALSARDIERLAVDDPPPLPDAFAALARLEAASGEAAARGDFRVYLASAGGPSGARLLGRFCHADPDLTAAVAGHLRAEEALRPDAVFAEVVHLPEGRPGNLLVRPAGRRYEIPYLGRSGVPPDRQIPLDDLRVSVDGARVVLRSARLGREVVPRLTSAHNFAAGPPVYRFLCALQGQGVSSGVAWDWGPLAGSAFLPRIVSGRLVLARARWRVPPDEAARLRATRVGRAEAVRRWRSEWRLPRWVCLTDGDNELPIDLDDEPMVEVLLGEFRDGQPAILTELFPHPDRLCAGGPDGRYVHELVVPFVRCSGADESRESGPERNGHAMSHPPAVRRTFPPGSEWLTVKLYAGPLVVDHLVRDVVGPLASELVDAELARLWFFVRYADPHWHLRLRFAGEPARLLAVVLPRVREAVAPLVADGRVWKVQIDTYEREVERYGGPAGIGPCEQLFHHDSRAAVELLRMPDDDPRCDRRWRLTLLGMHRMLDDLGLDPDAGRRVLRHVRDGFRIELRMGGPVLGRLGAKYRAESHAVAALLTGDSGPEWSAAREVFDRRSRAVRRAATALTATAADLAPSLLHMHANRLLRAAHRFQEAVLYDFLCRHADGAAARRASIAGAVPG